MKHKNCPNCGAPIEYDRDKCSYFRTEERTKTINEFIDVVLNRHILTKENKEALKFILEYAKEDMLKSCDTCKNCVNYDKNKGETMHLL